MEFTPRAANAQRWIYTNRLLCLLRSMGFSSGVFFPKTLASGVSPSETLESPAILNPLTTTPVQYSGGITARSTSPSPTHDTEFHIDTAELLEYILLIQVSPRELSGLRHTTSSIDARTQDIFCAMMQTL